ncbi:hypothetical protein BMG523Draft_00401 [Frankia sp. BMG5.23]|nr:hypothetical protein BMG523Draft_00401 [Frankia sp. BMG5.23]
MPPDVTELTTVLTLCYRNGIRLPTYMITPDVRRQLTDMIAPPRVEPEEPDALLRRAFAAHAIIKASVAAIGGSEARALRLLLDLDGKEKRSVTDRRADAAEPYDITGGSFLRRHQRTVTEALAAEIWRRLTAAQPTADPQAIPMPSPCPGHPASHHPRMPSPHPTSPPTHHPRQHTTPATSPTESPARSPSPPLPASPKHPHHR